MSNDNRLNMSKVDLHSFREELRRYLPFPLHYCTYPEYQKESPVSYLLSNDAEGAKDTNERINWKVKDG